ncbi:carbohydrate ABC transporter permease [Arthrobacter sp. HY1533]|uniref:carbohydrate ABC transporter permease n=1 Tax=Arthrobacter sp. HY1533 TaxID=2970919 RepID=UPI0022B9F1D6|nr:sugar ABC transporter permease [Arthrobacter sp. HY1533]
MSTNSAGITLAGRLPRHKLKNRRNARLLLLMLGPSALLIGVFVVAPVIYAFYLSLTNTTLLGFEARNPKFIGLDNFKYLLGNGDFLSSLGKTGIFIALSAIIGQTALGMISALLLKNKWMRAKGIFGAAIVMPMVVPEVVASLAWASMLYSGPEGTVNMITHLFGMGAVAWLQQYALISIIVINIWRGIAFAMIMFQAALEDVPDELIEAARIDGASALQIFRVVTLPLIRGPVFLYLLLTAITTAGIFGLVYFLTQGGPGGDTQLVALFIFDRAFQFSQIGLGSAASVIMLVIVLILGLTYVRVAKVEV